ncbi:MAG: Maf family protein [Panacagrimonas sp.]
MTQDFYLASRSPRRAELLRRAGFAFECLPVDVPEQPRAGESPLVFASRLALEKAGAALARATHKRPVLGADTDVSIDGEILGKPVDRDDAVRMLLRLSDRGHEVFSAVAVVTSEGHRLSTTRTEVAFGRITSAEAGAYWDTGEPADKAGAYAIQGLAARWVREIRGSYTGVVGLPLYETIELLRGFGVTPR